MGYCNKVYPNIYYNSPFFVGNFTGSEGKGLHFPSGETIMINSVLGNKRNENKGEISWQKNY